MSASDGGPAFPRPTVALERETEWGADGMTLRDWFAGQALAGFCSRLPDDLMTTDRAQTLAIAADMVAVAMLAERDR